MQPAWAEYLDGFHASHPGITEGVLARSLDGPLTPYRWLVEGIDPAARSIDLGCGSAPTRTELGPRWVGLDLSTGELRRAAARGRGPLVRGDASRLPLPPGVADVVVCSMSLMLVADLPATLAEIRRVLRPGGSVHLLLPARRPLTTADRLRYGRLFLALRSTTHFPPSPLRSHLGEALDAAGLEVDDDRTRRFSYVVADAADADRLVDSWYLPGISDERRAAARRRGRRMAPTSFGIPLRRVVAHVRR